MDKDKICRICLVNTHLLMYLFEGPDSAMLAPKIVNLTKVEISLNDGLPSSICVNCNKKVDECIEFINLCKESDNNLRFNNTNYTSMEGNDAALEENTDECKLNPKYKTKDFQEGSKEVTHKKGHISAVELQIKVYEDKKSLRQQCFTCGKIMSSPFRLKTHLATHLKDKPHSCPYCKKKFTIIENLNTHIRIHTGEKPYCCPMCGERFAQSSGLIVHKRKHTGLMPYQCVLCPRSFQTIGNFKYHVRVHTGERNYGCSKCDRAFITRGDLKQHTITHSGDKPHVCSVCRKRFSRASNLKRHASYFHTAEKYFTCQHCSLKFPRKADLNKHEKCHKITK